MGWVASHDALRLLVLVVRLESWQDRRDSSSSFRAAGHVWCRCSPDCSVIIKRAKDVGAIGASGPPGPASRSWAFGEREAKLGLARFTCSSSAFSSCNGTGWCYVLRTDYSVLSAVTSAVASVVLRSGRRPTGKPPALAAQSIHGCLL